MEILQKIISEITKPDWILVFTSLLGNYFVNKKNVIGQWLWAISNVGWITFFVWKGIPSSAFLFTVYLGFCIWGIIRWTSEAKNKNQSPSA